MFIATNAMISTVLLTSPHPIAAQLNVLYAKYANCANQIRNVPNAHKPAFSTPRPPKTGQIIIYTKTPSSNIHSKIKIIFSIWPDMLFSKHRETHLINNNRGHNNNKIINNRGTDHVFDRGCADSIRARGMKVASSQRPDIWMQYSSCHKRIFPCIAGRTIYDPALSATLAVTAPSCCYCSNVLRISSFTGLQEAFV